MKRKIFLLSLAALLILTACGKAVPKPHNGQKGGQSMFGELLSFSYSPGYSDMDGGNHVDRLEKNENGEWRIESRNKDSLNEPLIITTYAVSADAVSRFTTFLKEKEILLLADRKDSDLFITDYSPWSYRMTFDNSAIGGEMYASCTLWEYKQYSDQDYELLKELDQQFKSLYGDIISVTEEDKK